MANIASSALRQAGRLCQKATVPATGPLQRRLGLRTGAAAIAPVQQQQRVSRRGYVSESKRDNAQVAIETAIHLDKKDFIDVVPGVADAPGARVSPMAGMAPSSHDLILATDSSKQTS
jgi:cysteine desulfurase